LDFSSFFNTLYQVFSTSPWWVQIILLFSIGICSLAVLGICVCNLFLTPLYGRYNFFPKIIILHTWHAGITSLIAIFKFFHIPTESLERGKNTYENEIRRLEGTSSNRSSTVKDKSQKATPVTKHSYKDIEE
jgi:hypothetical protein